jgi:hypothetical protein
MLWFTVKSFTQITKNTSNHHSITQCLQYLISQSIGDLYCWCARSEPKLFSFYVLLFSPTNISVVLLFLCALLVCMFPLVECMSLLWLVDTYVQMGHIKIIMTPPRWCSWSYITRMQKIWTPQIRPKHVAVDCDFNIIH